MDDHYQNKVDSQSEDDYQNKRNCWSEEYKNDIFIQKLPPLPKVPSMPGTVRDSEVKEKETEPPRKVPLHPQSKRRKQISLAWFASKVDKWKDSSRILIIIIYGLILLSFIMATSAFVIALLRCFPTCPEGWKYFNEKCYNYSSEKSIWINSRRLCQEEGADLAVIDHEEEEDFLVYMMSSKDVHWIGCSDLEKEETCKNWYTRELNNTLDQAPEYCQVLQQEHNLMQNGLLCGDKYKYICEKNMQLACVWQALHISH